MPESISDQEVRRDATPHLGSLHPGPLGPPARPPCRQLPVLMAPLSLLTTVPLSSGPWLILPVNKQAVTSQKSLQMLPV